MPRTHSADQAGVSLDPAQPGDWLSSAQYSDASHRVYVLELPTFTDRTKTPTCVVTARSAYDGAAYDARHVQVSVGRIAWSNAGAHWRLYALGSQVDAGGNLIPAQQAFDFICALK